MSDVEPVRRARVQPQTRPKTRRGGRGRRVATMRVPSTVATCRVQSDQGPVEIRVDASHAWLLKAWTWRVNNRGYVMRKTSQRVPGLPHPRNISYLLHRVIMGLQHGDPRVVDHLNGDPLDNRLSNLEIVTQSENIRRVYHS